nr:hypothetical protein [Tanacetum cinerariifolium]
PPDYVLGPEEPEQAPPSLVYIPYVSKPVYLEDTWIDPRDVAEEEALTTLKGVNTRVTELDVVQEQDTQDIYGVMEDTQGRQTKIFQRVKDQRIDAQDTLIATLTTQLSSLQGHLATALGEI